jgi:hypothetical protein
MLVVKFMAEDKSLSDLQKIGERKIGCSEK